MSNRSISLEVESGSQRDAPSLERGRRPFVVACIPAYEEERNIAKVITTVRKYVDRVIVCDDGSKDMTAEIASALGAEVIRHGRNLGYGAALSSLFKRAREANADIMVTIDADGQHDPADVPRLTVPITDGKADIVIGSRFSGAGSQEVPAYRRLGIRMITKLSEKAGGGGSEVSLTDAQSGLRAYSRRALELVRPSEMGMGASTEILSHARSTQLKVAEVPVTISYGEDSSTHNPVIQGLDVVLSTVKHLSIKHPLMAYGIPGFAVFVVALVFAWWDLTLYVGTHRVVTNIALVAVAMGLIGLILMAVAVMLWVLISVIRERT